MSYTIIISHQIIP